MKIVTCASYFATGSSAVTDLISEYDGVKSLTKYEFRFLHDPDGVSELEYNLVENFNRHNSGHALKRYRKLVEYYSDHLLVRRYEPFFGNHWKELSYRYIDALTDFSYAGYWQYDFYDRGPWFEFWHKLPGRILSRTLWKVFPATRFATYHDVTLASHPTEEKFLECTRAYTDALMQAANPENKPFVMMDQILPSSNIKRHMRYLNNTQAVIVDRDPRDVFLLEKYEYNEAPCPKNVEDFCKWFRYCRETKNQECYDDRKVLILQFEDLIYHYEETKQKLIAWVGLKESDHREPFKYLDPRKSIKNTRYWVSHPQYRQEADRIAELLPEFLYDYSEIEGLE